VNTVHYNHICPILTAIPISVCHHNEQRQLLLKEHNGIGKTGKYKYALDLQVTGIYIPVKFPFESQRTCAHYTLILLY
jgi:hypothetical protein